MPTSLDLEKLIASLERWDALLAPAAAIRSPLTRGLVATAAGWFDDLLQDRVAEEIAEAVGYDDPPPELRINLVSGLPAPACIDLLRDLGEAARAGGEAELGADDRARLERLMAIRARAAADPLHFSRVPRDAQTVIADLLALARSPVLRDRRSPGPAPLAPT